MHHPIRPSPLVLLVASAFLVAITHQAAAQVAQLPETERLALQAERDWDTGHFVEALEAAEILLAGARDADHARRIAKLTGEVYHTTELTHDGALPAISASGRYVGYATRGDDAVTRVVDRRDGARVVAELQGAHRLIFAPDEASAAWIADGRIGLVVLPNGAIRPSAVVEQEIREAVFGADGYLYTIVGTADESEVHRFEVNAAGFGAPQRQTSNGGRKSGLVPVSQHGRVVYGSGDSVRVHAVAGAAVAYPAAAWAVSRDGSALAFRATGGGRYAIHVVDLSGTDEPSRIVFESAQRLGDLAVSPRGERVAFQLMMPENNWEIYTVRTAGGAARRVSNEPQHDWAPHFLTANTLYALKGERRNRRIFHYDLESGETIELFLNNTVRTVEPQTEWFASTDGTAIVIRADRDGNTVSPEQGVYFTDLTRPVTAEEALARVRRQLASERDLRSRGVRMFAPIADRVRAATSGISRDRMSEYVAGLVAIPGRHIAEPGNAPATEWVAGLFRSFGYEPERQHYRAGQRDQQNVFVTVPGTTNPELIYVVGAHFDAVRNVPGADDDATGMAVVFEAARVLRENPQPATIVFIGTNGEEAGLYGARAWVQAQVAAGTKVMGFFNHEVIGWANDHRMDNTIRHNNNDLRDATHAAAFLFSRLITYDSYYVRSTDAAVFHDAFGEIVTALAGFPLLGNPHYHQPSDDVRTINMQLVSEAAKTTVATVMLMASSPAPVKELRLERRAGSRAEIAWAASPERDVVSYTVAHGPAGNPEASSVTVGAADGPRVMLENVAAGTVVKVRANTRDGLHGWGWARLTVE